MLKFKCPCCNGEERQIEQITSDCTIAQVLTFDDENEEPEYGEPEVYGGYIERFQCQTCGFIIGKDEDTEPPDSIDELYEWLKDHQ